MAQKAYNILHDRILRGAYPLGTKLSRRKIAADLQISVLPVSEALKRLENEGLLESRPRVGTRIRIPSPQEIRGILEVREALECQSARLFCQRATAEERAVVRQMARELDETNNRWIKNLADQELWLQCRQLDFQLHLKIAEYSRCEPLYQLLKQNHILAQNLFNIVTMGERNLFHKEPHSDTRHQNLAEAISGNDIEIAEAAMRKHIHPSLQELLNGLQACLKWDESHISALSAARRRNPVLPKPAAH